MVTLQEAIAHLGQPKKNEFRRQVRELILDPTGCTCSDDMNSRRNRFELALKKAEEGSAFHQCFVGYCYAVGRYVARDYRRAVRWFRKAVAQGQLEAFFNLGLSYLDGQGVRRNNKKAAELFRLGALRGDTSAQTNYGIRLLLGEGVTKNLRAGNDWLRKAAQKGDALAQYNLHLSYEAGYGVKRDNKKALEWLTKAANGGEPVARRKLTKLRRGSGRPAAPGNRKRVRQT